MKMTDIMLPTKAQIKKYEDYLRISQECADNTIEKYIRELKIFIDYLKNETEYISKAALITWKSKMELKYKASSINSKIAAINKYLTYVGLDELKIKSIKVQKRIFCDESEELDKKEYIKLIKTADLCKKYRLSLMLQTICSTGIRVSELKYITVDALAKGMAEVEGKRKRRIIFLPRALCEKLKKYAEENNKIHTDDMIFSTKAGKEIDRSNIWRDMKVLCKKAEIDERKAYPHNLRHLFARTFYEIDKDISKLADVLGHTNINTTRIYLTQSMVNYMKQIDKMELITT